MQIKITDLLKTPGIPFEFEFEYFPESITVYGEEFKFNGGVKVSATCVYTGRNYSLQGTINGGYITVCDRCADAVEGNLDINYNEEFSTHEDLSHPDRYLFDGQQIDLTKMVEDNIVLAMPMKHLCKPECKGLCAVCGCNLNNENCDCSQSQIEEDIKTVTPFAGLKKLLDENEEV